MYKLKGKDIFIKENNKHQYKKEDLIHISTKNIEDYIKDFNITATFSFNFLKQESETLFYKYLEKDVKYFKLLPLNEDDLFFLKEADRDTLLKFEKLNMLLQLDNKILDMFLYKNYLMILII